MTLYIIECHSESSLYYVDEDEIDFYTGYCDQCGDSDTFIGEFENWKQLKKSLTYDGWCGYSDEYLMSIFDKEG